MPTGMITTPAAPTRGRLRPIDLRDIHITGGFWAKRQMVNATATLAHIEYWLEREGWIANFDLAAARRLPEGRRGREFSDSEVFKYLEALAWEIGRTADEASEARFRAVVARVAAAQELDGYLNTQFGRPGQAPRWSNLEWGHELYCLAHLFQAAVARARTRPDADDGLLAIARRAADHICLVFGPGGVESVCGHAAIEPALAELARITGENRYLEQAALFVERHGQGSLADIEWGRSYYQDDMPVREATILRGHAVRALYLSAGAVDVAVEKNDVQLLAALATQWSNTVARRTYITGGQGSRHQDEAFGDDWALPPDRAYSETCAGVASIMFSWRLLLAQGLPQYADLIERTLYNVIATSQSHEGTSFFYANTLHQRQPGRQAPLDVISRSASSSTRAPWFEVSCCPTNVARTLASLAAYLATTDDGGVQLHQYASAKIRTNLRDGRQVVLDVETAYPHDGAVYIRIGRGTHVPWTLTLRIPNWAEGARLVVRPVDAPSSEQAVEPGNVRIHRAFREGELVELHLPMIPRFVAPDPRIDAVRGCLAIERGPEVFCLESLDLTEASGSRIHDVAEIQLDPSVPPRDATGGIVVNLRPYPPTNRAWPYGALDLNASKDDGVGFDVPLIPYRKRAERGPASMRVWLPAATAMDNSTERQPHT